MRRPFLAFCFSMAMGIVLACYTDLKFWQLGLIAGTAAFAVLFFSDRLHPLLTLRCLKRCGSRKARNTFARQHPGWDLCRTFLVCLAVFLAGFGRMAADKADTGQFADFEGNVMTAEGIVVTAVPKETYTAVTVACRNERVLLRVDTTDTDYAYRLPGRKVCFTGKISLPEGRRNPGGFDYARYLKGKGVHVIFQVSAFRLSAGPVVRPLRNYLSTLKGSFFARIRTVMDEENFAILAALVFGAKDYLEEDVYETFQDNGIAHILAVSGLHVGLLYGLAEKLAGGRKDRRTMALTGGLLFCYAALSDFSVSVLRAALMIALRMAALPLRRRYDMVSAASAAAMVFLLARPYQLFDSGFQLSFMAAYTMGVCIPWLKGKVYGLADQKRKTWIRLLGDTVGPGLMIQTVMLPLTLYHFMTFSPLALLLNPAAIFLAGLLLPAGLAAFGAVFVADGASFLAGSAVSLLPVAGAVSCTDNAGSVLFFSGISVGGIGSAVMAAAAGPAQFLCRALALLSNMGARACGGFAAAAPPLAAVLLWYLLLFFFFSETRYILCRSGKGAASVKAAVVLAVLCCSVPYQLNITNSLLPWKYNDYPIVFLDVGQGDCCHIRIRLPAKELNILIDGGGTWSTDIAERTLEPYLLKNGVSKIDLAIVTHTDQDHAKGIRQLAQRMEIGTIAFPACYRSLLPDADQTVSLLSDAGQTVSLLPAATAAAINAVGSGTSTTSTSSTSSTTLTTSTSSTSFSLSSYPASHYLFLQAGDEIPLGPDAALTVLAPAAGSIASGDENENCLVMLLRYKDLKVFFAADMTAAGEAALLEAFSGTSQACSDSDTVKSSLQGKISDNSSPLSADILKLAHHGSGGSSTEAFVAAVDPAFAVISCGKNNSYGHPAERVVDLLRNSDIIYGRTDCSGALCLRSFSPGFILFENAAKDTQWLIPKKQNQQENTPPAPS